MKEAARMQQAPEAPGRLVDVGGFRLHAELRGEGAPAVVLEAAIGDFGLTWSAVAPEVARFTTVCAYDRAGLGWSDPSPRPRTVDVMVEELRALLDAAAIASPYVLVAQSSGGLISRFFAHLHPEEVAGLVMVDASHEEQFLRFPESIRALWGPMSEMHLQQLQALREAATEGTLDPALLPVPEIPPEAAATYRALAASGGKVLGAMHAELALLEESQAAVRDAGIESLGDLPLVVLSHSIPPPAFPPETGVTEEDNAAYEETWQELQREIAARSSRGERIVVEGAGHMIHHDRPEAVVDAIRSVVDAAR